MKSDHRRELAENALAKWLAGFLEGLKPYKNHIYWTVIVILLAFCALSAWSYVYKEGQKKAWNRFLIVLNRGDIEELGALCKDYTSGEVAVRLRIALGESYLQEGLALLHQNRSEDLIDKLQRALDYFAEAQKMNHRDPLLAQEILYGLAQTYESLAVARTDGNDYADAVETFGKLVNDYPEGIYREEVQKRLTMLENPSTQRLFTFLNERPKVSAETATDGTSSPWNAFDPALPDPTRSFELPETLQSPSETETLSPPSNAPSESDASEESPLLLDPGFELPESEATDRESVPTPAEETEKGSGETSTEQPLETSAAPAAEPPTETPFEQPVD